MKKPGRPQKFKFLIQRLKPDVHYSPATIADLVTEADVEPFNQHQEKKVKLGQIRLRARTTLAAYRRRYITVDQTGVVNNRGVNLPAWNGNIWKSAFGLGKDTTLHGGK